MTASLPDPLRFAARHGRWVLVVGLGFGIGAPGLATVLRPFVPHMAVLLLFLAALRIGPAVFVGAVRALPATLAMVLTLQLALPLAVIGLATAAGVANTPTILAIAIMTAAPSIVSSPNMVAMLGARPDTAMRLMVSGTALLPLTVIPVFWALPELGALDAVLRAALRLLALVVVATGVAFALRRLAWPAMSAVASQRLDGMSALVLAVFVIGLMPSVGAMLRGDPWQAAYWLAVVFAVNVGLQLVTSRLLRHRPGRVPVALISGNRNMALFLVALPPEVTDPILPFIGCYQIPMFLTPLLMERLYRPRVRVTPPI